LCHVRSLRENVAGRPPATAGWQPALPIDKALLPAQSRDASPTISTLDVRR